MNTSLSERKLKRVKTDTSKVAISLNNVSKKYTIHHEKPTFVEALGKKLRKESVEEYWALRNVNLTIYQGEKVGLHGPNGAGKTTLLKLVSGIAFPTFGQIKTNGKIVSLIDLGAGFHPDLTGQENIFLNGFIVGMSKEEIEDKFMDILNFSGIGKFITAPLYTYSSGMMLRLAFSIAIHASPDILLLDETMMVGDKEFNDKAQQVLHDFFVNDKTVLMVSHFQDYLEENCTRIIEIKSCSSREF